MVALGKYKCNTMCQMILKLVNYTIEPFLGLTFIVKVFLLRGRGGGGRLHTCYCEEKKV